MRGGEGKQVKGGGRGYFEVGVVKSKSTLQLFAQQPPHAEATLEGL